MKYLAVLGRTPELALLELTSFFPGTLRIAPNIAVFETEQPLDPVALLAKLGGTVKIAVYETVSPSINAQVLADHLEKKQSLVFGVSVFGDAPFSVPKLLTETKQLLSAEGVSHVRFVTPRDGKELTSVVVAKNELQELLLVAHDGGWIIGQTLGVQPFEAWGERDFGRPFADARAGMLPPKVALMIVNIAGSGIPDGQPKTLLDPFCGMGTVVAEALLMGWQATGSDTSEKAIARARGNIDWLKRANPAIAHLTTSFFVGDAVHVSEKVGKESVDAIATEPYMGSTSVATAHAPDPVKVKNVIKGLEKLYIGCLKDWTKILKPKGKVVIALPAYSVGNTRYFVKKVVDMCENLGYTILAGPIEYSRPQAVVKRMFYVLQKN